MANLVLYVDLSSLPLHWIMSPSSEDWLACELELQLDMLELDEDNCGSLSGDIGGDWSSSWLWLWCSTRVSGGTLAASWCSLAVVGCDLDVCTFISMLFSEARLRLNCVEFR